MGLVGVLTVGLQVRRDGSLLVGGLLPRVGSAGRWTIEGAATSQYDQHLRAICGLPLGDVALRAPAVATVVRETPEERIMDSVTALGAIVDEALSQARDAAARNGWR